MVVPELAQVRAGALEQVRVGGREQAQARVVVPELAQARVVAREQAPVQAGGREQVPVQVVALVEGEATALVEPPRTVVLAGAEAATGETAVT